MHKCRLLTVSGMSLSAELLTLHRLCLLYCRHGFRVRTLSKVPHPFSFLGCVQRPKSLDARKIRSIALIRECRGRIDKGKDRLSPPTPRQAVAADECDGDVDFSAASCLVRANAFLLLHADGKGGGDFGGVRLGHQTPGSRLAQETGK